MQSPVLATVEMSVRPSVCHTLALCQNDASYDREIFIDDRPRTLALVIKRSSRNTNGFTPSEGVK